MINSTKMEFKEKVFGSHNTMTYLRPSNWLLYLGHLIMSKCQSKTWIEQISNGARVLDIRVFPEYNKSHNVIWRYGHGLVKFSKSKSPNIYLIAKTLNDKAKLTHQDYYMRIILEKCKSETDVENFVMLCEGLEKEFPYVKFLGGNRKSDWRKCYTFLSDITDNNVNQPVSSMAPDARWYEKVCPWLYAKRTNKVNKDKMINGINLFDFI